MLITVIKNKLVLGHTVYVKGDVFECRDGEAKILIGGRLAVKSAVGAKATKGSPMAPKTGVSKQPQLELPVQSETRTQTTSTLVAAPRLGRGRQQQPAAQPSTGQQSRSSAQTPPAARQSSAASPVTPPAGSAVGAMTMADPSAQPNNKA